MKNNFLNKIRVRNGLSVEEFANILGITKQGLYFIMKANKPLQKKYLNKIQHLLTNEEKEALNKINTVITNFVKQTDENINNSQQLRFYNSFDDFIANIVTNDKNNKIQQLFKNNQNIAICKFKNDNLIIDTEQRQLLSEGGLYAIKNNLSDKTVAFFAHLRIDELTGKTLIKLENGAETVMPETCKIIGRVVSKIVSV